MKFSRIQNQLCSAAYADQEPNIPVRNIKVTEVN